MMARTLPARVPAHELADAMRDVQDRRYPAKRMRNEDKFQIAVVEFLRRVLDQKRYLVAAVRNEGKRSAIEGARAKRMGLVPGMLDLQIIGPGGAVWLLELKTETGIISAEQKSIHAWCASAGVPYAVCRSLDDVRSALSAWRIETRESAQL
jgi:hypothetical protein